MFYRIEVNVIEMACEIVFISRMYAPNIGAANASLRFTGRLAEIRSSSGSSRENALLINRHRRADLGVSLAATPDGMRWSGSVTVAAISNGLPRLRVTERGAQQVDMS